MRKKTTFADLYADVEQLEQRLSAPTAFYQEHEAPYHETARQIARRIMLAARPPDSRPDDWRKKTERVVDLVTSHLMLAGLGGMVLSAQAPSDQDTSLDPKEFRPSRQTVTHNDVMEWVKAGETNQPGGKIWKQQDYKRYSDAGGGEKGYSAIATIVMRAYYSRKPQANYSRLRSAIQSYLYGGEAQATNPILDAILTAWHEHFQVRLHRDLRHHVTEVIGKF